MADSDPNAPARVIPSQDLLKGMRPRRPPNASLPSNGSKDSRSQVVHGVVDGVRMRVVGGSDPIISVVEDSRDLKDSSCVNQDACTKRTIRLKKKNVMAAPSNHQAMDPPPAAAIVSKAALEANRSPSANTSLSSALTIENLQSRLVELKNEKKQVKKGIVSWLHGFEKKMGRSALKDDKLLIKSRYVDLKRCKFDISATQAAINKAKQDLRVISFVDNTVQSPPKAISAGVSPHGKLSPPSHTSPAQDESSGRESLLNIMKQEVAVARNRLLQKKESMVDIITRLDTELKQQKLENLKLLQGNFELVTKLNEVSKQLITTQPPSIDADALLVQHARVVQKYEEQIFLLNSELSDFKESCNYLQTFSEALQLKLEDRNVNVADKVNIPNESPVEELHSVDPPDTIMDSNKTPDTTPTPFDHQTPGAIDSNSDEDITIAVSNDLNNYSAIDRPGCLSSAASISDKSMSPKLFPEPLYYPITHAGDCGSDEEDVNTDKSIQTTNAHQPLVSSKSINPTVSSDSAIPEASVYGDLSRVYVAQLEEYVNILEHFILERCRDNISDVPVAKDSPLVETEIIHKFRQASATDLLRGASGKATRRGDTWTERSLSKSLTQTDVDVFGYIMDELELDLTTLDVSCDSLLQTIENSALTSDASTLEELIDSLHYQNVSADKPRFVEPSDVYNIRKRELSRYDAAIEIQRRWRGYCGRKQFIAEIERQFVLFLNSCAVRIQACFRGYLVRKIVTDFVISGHMNSDEAAVCIQRWIRGTLVRCKIHKLHKAAREIQRIYRGYRGRRKFLSHVEFLLVSEIGFAATVIQAAWRGYSARKHMLLGIPIFSHEFDDAMSMTSSRSTSSVFTWSVDGMSEATSVIDPTPWYHSQLDDDTLSMLSDSSDAKYLSELRYQIIYKSKVVSASQPEDDFEFDAISDDDGDDEYADDDNLSTPRFEPLSDVSTSESDASLGVWSELRMRQRAALDVALGHNVVDDGDTSVDGSDSESERVARVPSMPRDTLGLLRK